MLSSYFLFRLQPIDESNVHRIVRPSVISRSEGVADLTGLINPEFKDRPLPATPCVLSEPSPGSSRPLTAGTPQSRGPQGCCSSATTPGLYQYIRHSSTYNNVDSIVLPEYLDLRMPDPPPPCPRPKTRVTYRKLQLTTRAQSVPDLLGDSRWTIDPYVCNCQWIPWPCSGRNLGPYPTPTRQACHCGCTEGNGHQQHKDHHSRYRPPHHKAEVSFTRPRCVSRTSAFDSTKMLLFRDHEILSCPSSSGCGHTSDCHSHRMPCGLLSRNTGSRLVTHWTVPEERMNLCEYCGSTGCSLYPQYNASGFRSGYRFVSAYVNQHIYDATKFSNDQDAYGETPVFENEDDVREFVVQVHDNGDDDDNRKNVQPSTRERRFSVAFNDAV